MLKIFHTSDIHLGMKFSAYPEVQDELIEARFRTLERLVAIANNHKCHMFVIAGDLFDKPSVAKKDVIRAADILKDFEGSVVTILPGNHDYILQGQKDLWDLFREHTGDNVIILGERREYDLTPYDINVIVYACPCFSKHSDTNATGWIKRIDNSDFYHIGIAHGALEGVSPDFDRRFYPMRKEELLSKGLDLWLLGHTHIPYPPEPERFTRIFYGGTPEPDGFDCDHGGNAWLLTLNEERQINATKIKTGQYVFSHDDVSIEGMEDIKVFINRYKDVDLSHTLLKLRISGRIDQDEREALLAQIERLRKELFYPMIDMDGLIDRITPEVIDREFSTGSFPYILLTELIDDPEALQIAYELIKEVQE